MEENATNKLILNSLILAWAPILIIRPGAPPQPHPHPSQKNGHATGLISRHKPPAKLSLPHGLKLQSCRNGAQRSQRA